MSWAKKVALATAVSVESKLVLNWVEALVLMGTGEKLWIGFVPKYLEFLGATVLVIGLFDALQTLLGAVYAYPGGWLTDRWGQRRSLLAFNALSIGVTASLNNAGDGILLTDTAGGPGKLTVDDVGTGTAAKDLHLAGEAAATTIDGSTTYTIALDAGDTLDDLVERVGELRAKPSG